MPAPGAAGPARRLCTECDTDEFPRGFGEGYLPVHELRDRIYTAQVDQMPGDRFLARLVVAIKNDFEPDLTVTVDGAPVPIGDIDELQAGADGWVVCYGIGRPVCPQCGAGYVMLVLFGEVAVSGIVPSIGARR